MINVHSSLMFIFSPFTPSSWPSECSLMFLEVLMFSLCLFQLKTEKERLSCTELWLSGQVRIKFYQTCCETFTQYNISVSTISTFYKVRRRKENTHRFIIADNWPYLRDYLYFRPLTY